LPGAGTARSNCQTTNAEGRTVSKLYYDRTDAGLGLCKLEVGTFENNIYLLWDLASRDAYVFDGGFEPAAIADAVRERDLHVLSIVVTHGHLDHHQEVAELKQRLGVPVVIGEADQSMLKIEADGVVQDGDVLHFGAHALRAMHTPGHTPGSTCYVVGKHLFTGDTLFPGGPGNTQKDPARFATIIDSISTKLFTLPEDTTVYPGHGLDTTIGREVPQLQEWIDRGW
jgi:glyoxylase-like metal-dependent hydrolase (beta-lactamase superfamily II)